MLLLWSYQGILKNNKLLVKQNSSKKSALITPFFLMEIESSFLNKSMLQALPDVPPAMADAVNRGSEFFANLSVGTPWETVAKEVNSTLGIDSNVLRAETSKDINILVDVITSWMASNSGAKVLRP